MEISDSPKRKGYFNKTNFKGNISEADHSIKDTVSAISRKRKSVDFIQIVPKRKNLLGKGV